MGIDPYLNLLTAQTTVLAHQQTLNNLQVQQMASAVAPVAGPRRRVASFALAQHSRWRRRRRRQTRLSSSRIRPERAEQNAGLSNINPRKNDRRRTYQERDCPDWDSKASERHLQ